MFKNKYRKDLKTLENLKIDKAPELAGRVNSLADSKHSYKNYLVTEIESGLIIEGRDGIVMDIENLNKATQGEMQGTTTTISILKNEVQNKYNYEEKQLKIEQERIDKIREEAQKANMT